MANVILAVSFYVCPHNVDFTHSSCDNLRLLENHDCLVVLFPSHAEVSYWFECHIVNFELTGCQCEYKIYCIYTHPVNSKFTI